jgi:4-amino-4-deoxy-L-arabinose transferase-like glycosyltransferase
MLAKNKFSNLLKMEINNKNLFVVCFALCFIRILSLYFVELPLWVDEAQYWGWSKQLAFGYYSKPPFIAWLIALSSNLFNDSEFAIRFFAPICHLIVSICVYFISRNFYDNKTSLLSALIYISLPAVSISSNFISADAPLILFWALSLLLFIKLIAVLGNLSQSKNNFRIYFLYALCLGFGLLSKYTMAVFVFISFYCIIKNFGFKKIFNKYFFITNLFAFIIFFPNLVWNYHHNFVSFLHTSENVVEGKAGHGLKLLEMLEFIGGQFLVFGIGFYYYVIAIFKKSKNIEGKNFLILYSVPLILIAVIISLRSGAQAHWAGPAYVSASILLANYIRENNKEKTLRSILIFNFLICLICLNLSFFNNLIFKNKSPLERVLKPYSISLQLAKAISLNPDAVVMSDERKLISTQQYSQRTQEGQPKIIYKWNTSDSIKDHFDLTRKISSNIGKKIIYFGRTNREEEFKKIFSSVNVYLRPDGNSSFYIFILN